jgi:hypothetical protein
MENNMNEIKELEVIFDSLNEKIEKLRSKNIEVNIDIREVNEMCNIIPKKVFNICCKQIL